MKMHTEHIEDLVEGYALGALEPGERVHVEAHAAECPPCERQLRSTEATAHMLAFAAQPIAPPSRCKRRIMEKLEREQFLSTPTRRARTRLSSSTWTAFAAVTLLMMTGMWTFNTQRQLTRMRDEIVSTKAQLTTMNAQMTELSELLTTAEAVRSLRGRDVQAVGKTYMKPGSNQAVLVISGLEPLPPGKTYQVWVAREGLQQPLSVFSPQQSTSYVEITPPEPMDRYKAIMVTIENSGGATTPSDQTVLEGDL